MLAVEEFNFAERARDWDEFLISALLDGIILARHLRFHIVNTIVPRHVFFLDVRGGDLANIIVGV